MCILEFVYFVEENEVLLFNIFVEIMFLLKRYWLIVFRMYKIFFIIKYINVFYVICMLF